MDISSIALIILLLSASALCIFLIIYFNRITKSVENLNVELHNIADQITPVVESLQILSKNLSYLSDDVRTEINKVRWIIDEIKLRAELIFNFEENIREKIGAPAENLIKNLEAIKRGFSVFWQSLNRR